MREALVKLRERDAKYPEDIGEYAACLEAMDSIHPNNSFPRLAGALVHKSVRVECPWVPFKSDEYYFIVVEKLCDLVKVGTGTKVIIEG